MNKITLVSIVVFLKDFQDKGFFLWQQKRLEDGSLNGKWEFPGGKIHHGESPLDAALREVHEEVGVKVYPNPLNFKIYPYTYEGKNIALHVFLSFFKQIPENKGKWDFIDFKEKSGYLKGAIPSINHRIIDEIADFVQVEYNSWMP